MRLIPNFQDLLLKDQLPTRFSDWWIVEEEDRIQFPDHPFDTYGKGRWDEWDIRSFLKTTKREIGFFRKRNTPEEVRLQQCFRRQFPEALVLNTCDLHRYMRERRAVMEVLEHWQQRFDSALTPQEQVAELMRYDDDLPEVLLAQGTPKEVVS